jgi:mycothiol synthase
VLCYGDADPSRLYVGQICTRRPWRRGVAASLLAQVIAAANDAWFAMVTPSLDAESPTGAVGVYERVGFSVEIRAVTYYQPIPAAN